MKTQVYSSPKPNLNKLRGRIIAEFQIFKENNDFVRNAVNNMQGNKNLCENLHSKEWKMCGECRIFVLFKIEILFIYSCLPNFCISFELKKKNENQF